MAREGYRGKDCVSCMHTVTHPFARTRLSQLRARQARCDRTWHPWSVPLPTSPANPRMHPNTHTHIFITYRPKQVQRESEG